MRSIILIAHISLDGFVANAKGELSDFDASDENLAFVASLTERADAAMFGRISYQLLEAYWPHAKDRPHATEAEIEYSTWYHAATKIVFSRTLDQEKLTNTVIINKNIAEEITDLKNQEGKDIIIFGSPSISQLLMELSLIDEYWIFVNPVLFGKGIPLFAELSKVAHLELTSSKHFANGEFALHYVVER